MGLKHITYFIRKGEVHLCMGDMSMEQAYIVIIIMIVLRYKSFAILSFY